MAANHGHRLVDPAVAELIQDEDSETSVALAAQYAPLSALGRTVAKLRARQNISVCYVGDSGLEGNSASAGEDCASVVKTTIDARFGVTTTKANRAISGRTLGTYAMTSAAATTMLSYAISDAADLYVIAFGHNDIRSDVSATYTPGSGYPKVAGQAALEHLIRKIRIEVPDADIIVSSEWPYTGGSAGSNASLVAYQDGYRDVATAYGCTFVDYYAALVALGVGSGSDDTYVWPTGETYAQHPTDAGHAVWADLVCDLLPDSSIPAVSPWVPPSPIFGAERYTQTAWSSFTTAGRTLGTDGFRMVGAGWSSAGAMPSTSSTATNYFEVQWIGTEGVVRLDTGVGQGVVNIVVDGVTVNATLDLSALSAGQSYIPLPVYTPGVHRATVAVVSGSVTCRGVELQPMIGQHYVYTSGLISRVGTWSNPGSDATRYNGNMSQTTTQNDTITIEWVGTDLAAQVYQYTSGLVVDITTDGTTRASVTITNAVVANPGSYLVEADLPYGKHSTTITAKFATGTRVLAINAWFAYDRNRTERATETAGLAYSAETIDYGYSLPSIPLVTLAATDSTNALPPYPTSNAVTGFVANGTASAKQAFTAKHGRAAW